LTTISDNQSKRGQENYRLIGGRPIRHDGVDKVTGRAKYAADIKMAGVIPAKVLRSPHAHAIIKNIDISKALKLDGVLAIVTGRDMPAVADRQINLGEEMGNLRLISENCLAHDKVLYQGHAVAAVAAVDVNIAEQALKLIEVDYEVLKPVLSVQEAMAEDAPLLFENRLKTQVRVNSVLDGSKPAKFSNIASHINLEKGDVEEGFKNSDIIVEREYTTKMVHQGYIEPQSSTAFWSRDGYITIWTSTQAPFGIRATISELMDIPESNVKVVPMEIGGGFGGKIGTYLDPVAALLSKKVGHPVKISMGRKDVFEATGPTSGSYMRAKVGVTKDGKIKAVQMFVAFEAGAYPGSAVAGGANCVLSPYNVENFRIDGYDVVVNKPKTSAYRAPGAPITAYALEPVIDEIAKKLNMDPIDFRLINATKEGDRNVNGIAFSKIGCIEVEEAIKASEHYNSPLEGPNRGRGVAIGYWGNAGLQSSATIVVNTNGSINLITGSVDIGGTRTSVAMQAAEILGIETEDVNPTVADTDSIGWTGLTAGSRTAMSTGLAAINAAYKIIEEMKPRAGILWETKPEDVNFSDGVFTSANNSENKFTFKQLAGKIMATGGPISASASSNPAHVGVSFAGHIADVEVDADTGKVTILRYTAVQDVGQAGHLSYVEGQMQGGAAQGIGWALNEEYYYNEQGAMANSTFLDYRMPIALDLPMIETIVVEVPNPGHPFGIRGVGEVPIVPPMATIANAISNAIGVRITELPMNPRVILDAINKK
jgi:xanthine dehydrogenase molybdenum-binding subunit